MSKEIKSKEWLTAQGYPDVITMTFDNLETILTRFASQFTTPSTTVEQAGTGVELIAKERQRQIEVEKWDYTHDEDYKSGEMIGAAACYAVNAVNKDNPGFMRVQIHLPAETNLDAGNTGDRGDRQLRKAGWYDAWPWGSEWDKREKHDKMRSLVIAGALIAAEIDRLKNK